MSFSTKKSSVSRDFILLFSVLIGIVSIVSLWVSYRTFDNYVDGIISDIESEALRIDRSMIVEIKSASYLLESLARQIVQINDNQDIVRLLGSFHDSNKGRNDEIFWLNSAQDLIISSNSGIIEQKINFSDLDYIKKALTAPWQPHLGRPNNSKISNKWVLPLSIGVTNYKGDFIGILVIGIDMKAMTKELQEIVQLANMDFGIFTNSMGRIADSRQFSQKTAILDVSQIAELNKKIAQNRKAVLSAPNLFNHDIEFSYFEKSSQYPYIVYVNYNHVLHDYSIFSLLQARLAQILIIFCFLLTLLWMVKTRIIKPVEKLCEITRNINAGERYQPIAKSGPLEIEQLANQIRKLSDYLVEQNRTNSELKIKNQYLNKLKENGTILTNARIDFLAQASNELDQSLQFLYQQITDSIASLNKDEVNLRNELVESIQYIESARTIIADISHISEAQHANFHIRENSVNLTFMLHRAVRKFHELQRFRHIEVKLKTDESLPMMLADEEHFTNIIIYILCGAALSISQGNSIELSAQLEYNEHNQKELNIQIKYNSSNHHYKNTGITALSHENINSANDKQNIEPKIKSSIVNFLMARFLVNIFGGNMSMNVIKGETNRIFIRFPQKILLQNSD